MEKLEFWGLLFLYGKAFRWTWRIHCKGASNRSEVKVNSLDFHGLLLSLKGNPMTKTDLPSLLPLLTNLVHPSCWMIFFCEQQTWFQLVHPPCWMIFLCEQQTWFKLVHPPWWMIFLCEQQTWFKSVFNPLEETLRNLTGKFYHPSSIKILNRLSKGQNCCIINLRLLSFLIVGYIPLDITHWSSCLRKVRNTGSFLFFILYSG